MSRDKKTGTLDTARVSVLVIMLENVASNAFSVMTSPLPFTRECQGGSDGVPEVRSVILVL